jgi:hypothetical protein
MNLQEELTRHGCTLTPDEFREAVLEVFVQVAPTWTDEELLMNPECEGKQFLRAVRDRVKCPRLKDSVILKTLVSHRKYHKHRSQID